MFESLWYMHGGHSYFYTNTELACCATTVGFTTYQNLQIVTSVGFITQNCGTELLIVAELIRPQNPNHEVPGQSSWQLRQQCPWARHFFLTVLSLGKT